VCVCVCVCDACVGLLKVVAISCHIIFNFASSFKGVSTHGHELLALWCSLTTKLSQNLF